MSLRHLVSLRVIVVLAAGLSVGACDALDQLLAVEAPSKIDARDLESPSSAPLLVRSVANEFRCSLTHYVNASALVGTELAVPQNNASLVFYDQRRWTEIGFPAVHVSSDCEDGEPALYLTLSRTRWFADDLLARLAAWGAEVGANRSAYEAEVAAVAGYSYLMLGESMCSVAFDDGPEEIPAAALERSIERFDQAIAAASAAGRQDLLNLARVGKARALLDLDRKAAAGAVAAQVPEGFEYELRYSGVSDATYNKQYQATFQDDNATVEEPYRNMTYAGVADLRVRVSDSGRIGPGNGLAIWTPDKYSSVDSPIELATWEEAQLILAEAAAADGRLQDAVGIINRLHANVGLPPFASSDAGEIMDQIVYERRAELFLEGHHLMDIKRYGLPLEPAPGEVYPFGGTYGDQVCFPLPALEYLNNPNVGRR